MPRPAAALDDDDDEPVTAARPIVDFPIDDDQWRREAGYGVGAAVVGR